MPSTATPTADASCCSALSTPDAEPVSSSLTGGQDEPEQRGDDQADAEARDEQRSGELPARDRQSLGVDHGVRRGDADDRHREAGVQHPPAEPLRQEPTAEHRADRQAEADGTKADSGVERGVAEPQLQVERDRQHEARERTEEQHDDAESAAERALGEQAHA